MKFPGWIPLIGTDSYEIKAEFQSAQALTPGQGQSVNVAGVQVGEISSVNLKDGRAIVTMRIDDKDLPIYRDATMLVRPKTGLYDMSIQLNPGNQSSGKLQAGSTVPQKSTLPNVHTDEILSALDGDTRNYLKLLLNGASKGLDGQSRTLSQTLRRFQPTTRDIAKINGALAKRKTSLKRLVTNLNLLSNEVAVKDDQLAGLVSNANSVFGTLADQEQNIKAALRELPSTLEATDTALASTGELAEDLGPTAKSLRPGAKALANSLKKSKSLFKNTEQAISDDIRPFVRDVKPTVETLEPVAQRLAVSSPELTRSLKVLNSLLNALSYNPPGDKNEGYLFYTAWFNHALASALSVSDAHGPVRRGILTTTCDSLRILEGARKQNELLDLILRVVNPPNKSEVC